MKDYLTITEMSSRWNISGRRIRKLCLEGRIDGAVKMGTLWVIPADTEKPRDMREYNGKRKTVSLNAE